MVDEMDLFEKRLRDKEINWKWVFAHTVLIWIFTYVFGFMLGFTISTVAPEISEISFTSAETIPDSVMLLLAYSNLISTFLVVLVISLVQKITWNHLFLVLIILTILSFYNITFGFTFSDILFGSIYIGISMVIAKSLAMLILKTYEVIKK